MIKVVLISNDKTVLQRLVAQTDVELAVIQATTVNETVRLVKQQSPDIIISEQNMEEMDSDILCHYFTEACPSARNIILVESFPTFDMLQNSGFKVRGYLTPEHKHLVVKAVRVVHDGEAWLPRGLVADMLNYFSDKHSTSIDTTATKLQLIK